MNAFERENDELPGALGDLLRFYSSPEGGERLERWARLAEERKSVLFAGMGTSEFAGESIAWRLAGAGLCARSVDAGELYYNGADLPRPRPLVVLTSQSGESAEIRNLASQGWAAPYVAVTNDQESSLARGADLTLPLHAGREESITTKTYTNTITLFRLLESVLQGKAALARMIGALEEASRAMEKLDREGIEAAAEKLTRGSGSSGSSRPRGLAFAGRGDAVVSARQCSLTFMEGLRGLTSAFAGGAFRHGPFECVGPELGLILFRSAARTAHLTDGLARDAAAQGSPVVLFDGCALPRDASCTVIHVPRSLDAEPLGLFPILAARSHNLLLHAAAARRGIETGRFRHGSKVTSKE